MPKTILTLRDTENPNAPGEVREFDYVGAVMGGGQNSLLTFFNDDPVNADGQTGGPKPFYSVSASLVYSVETPDHNRPPIEAVPPLYLPGRMSKPH